MAASNPNFLHIWGDDKIRAALLSHVDDESMCSLRLTSSECCRLATPNLFARTRLNFTPSALRRPSRIEALSRIGHHIQHLTFSMPHTPATFLPPLLNETTGQEVTFLYTPHTSVASEIQRPKYGNRELGNVLTQQYPPIFHAASNVPAFIRAFSFMPNLRHLTVSCPGQDLTQRYRRDAVDYALISLRIAIERAHLPKLNKLSLSPIHPSALVYLRAQPGFGASPASTRRWKQIRKLKITLDAWDFKGLRPGLDHLKVIDDFVRSFSKNLEKISFTWNGLSGPCPLTLPSSPCFAPSREKGKLFGEVTSPMSPLPEAPPKPDMHFPKLRYMQVRNCVMKTQQVANLVYAHRHTVKEFDFEKISLLNGGTWEEALEPLRRMSGKEAWHSSQLGSISGSENESYQSCGGQSLPDSAIDVSDPIDPAAPTYESRPPDKDARRDSILLTKIKKRRIRRRRKVKDAEPDAVPKAEPEPMVLARRPSISAPIMITSINSAEPSSPLPYLQPTVFSPSVDVQGVQRNLSLESTHQLLVDDPDRRISTLRKAREAVLARLGNQFSKRPEGREQSTGLCNRRLGPQGRNMGLDKGSQYVPLMIFR